VAKRGRRLVHDRAWQAMLVFYALRLEQDGHQTDEKICCTLIRKGLYPGMSARTLRTRLYEARKVVTAAEITLINSKLPRASAPRARKRDPYLLGVEFRRRNLRM
jgi:hypothetical protein